MDRPELLAKLCEALPGLREVAAAHGLSGGLEKVLKAARDGESIEEPLRAIGLFSFITSVTVRGPGAEHSGMVGVPGMEGGGHVVTGVYRCPNGACGRIEHPAAGGDRPSCGVFRDALRYESN
ncbi:hypothetical protein [Glycomyces tenuis]|uniref:hypothetical protein n=1 Tax=Glycomyces tenuis TaxID=58116 RepID=UPI00042189FC|nr:hypothetical protein [Glycomyces tenuis]